MMTTKKYKTGLACMRGQPFHLGHKLILDEMCNSCARVYLALGSAQEEGTSSNPIPYLFRKYLVENNYPFEVFTKKLIIFPAEDIHDLPNWSKYLLDKIDEQVDVYFAGDNYDAVPFTEYPATDYPKVEVKVLDRKDNHFLSGSEIRKMFKEGDPTWKDYVPKDNIEATSAALEGKHPFPAMLELEIFKEDMGIL